MKLLTFELKLLIPAYGGFVTTTSYFCAIASATCTNGKSSLNAVSRDIFISSVISAKRSYRAAILFVASVLNWNDKYLPSQTPYTDEYDFESSCCLSKARYDYIYKCKVEEERYRTNGATYRWCRAGRKASKYIKKHAQEIKIPVLLCQAGKDYLVSNAAEDEFIAKLPQGIKKVYPDSKHEIFNADDDTLEKFYSDILDFWA